MVGAGGAGQPGLQSRPGFEPQLASQPRRPLPSLRLRYKMISHPHSKYIMRLKGVHMFKMLQIWPNLCLLNK